MNQVIRCEMCWRFENSMGRWVEAELETIVGLIIDPEMEIIHVVCPDCQASISDEVIEIETESG